MDVSSSIGLKLSDRGSLKGFSGTLSVYHRKALSKASDVILETLSRTKHVIIHDLKSVNVPWAYSARSAHIIILSSSLTRVWIAVKV